MQIFEWVPGEKEPNDEGYSHSKGGSCVSPDICVSKAYDSGHVTIELLYCMVCSSSSKA